MTEIDMSGTIVPKSDQMNADDLIIGPITIRVSKVSANPSSAEQPISIYYDGDQGKPYKPCKSMRRVLVTIWGNDGAAYPGRSMTLYRDPSVTWGGMAVGGIRISHMSDMAEPVTMALTATKQSRKPYRVLPLVIDPIDTYAKEFGRSIKTDGFAAWWAETEARRTELNIPQDRAAKMLGAATKRIEELKNANSGA